MSSQISVIMSATQGPAGPAGAAGSTGPAGATGPTGPAGVVADAGITSGTSTAYTAVLADRPEPLTAGHSFLIVPHVTNGVSPTISLSGGTAQPIWVKGAPIPAGAMVANTPYALRSDGTRCHVEGQLNLSADDIPATLNATTFAGGITLQKMEIDGQGDIWNLLDSEVVYLQGGNSNGGYLQINGSTAAIRPGYAEIGPAAGVSGARVRIMDKNNASQLIINETGIVVLGYNSTSSYPMIHLDADNDSLGIMGCSADTWNGCQVFLDGGAAPGNGGFWAFGSNATSELLFGYSDAGDRVRQRIGPRGTQCLTPAPVSIPTGGAWTTLCAIDGTQALRFATITAHGTILLEWNGTTLTKLAGAATLVVSGSPSGTEVGFRVSAGNLQASNGTGTSRNGSSGFSIQH